MKLLQLFIDYSSLGYDVTLTRIYFKDAIQMKKRYSLKAERSIICQQIFDHDKIDELRLRQVLEYMYQNIQEQESSGKYYEAAIV